MRRILAAFSLATAVLAGTAATAAAAPSSGAADVTRAAAASTAVPAGALDTCSSDFFDNDPRLGPAALPVFGIVGFELLGYQRTGGLSDQAFLAKYYDPTANGGRGGWTYPPDNGYVIGADGNPVETQLTLWPGQDIDRFGSEYGSFLAPEWLPYAARAIPPQSLDGSPAAGCNYHDYRVLKPFAVDAGPIAAWFAQPGGGLQYQLDASLVPGSPSRLNVMWLVSNGYLERLG
jgi:hypothetical protein